MAKRHNHYEAAFEDYLRAERVAYVAVDERRRALVDGGSLKSVDFIVSPEGEDSATRWLIDVKGRRFPSDGQYWRNWATRDDLRSLQRWSERFGPRFESLLVFAYLLLRDRSPAPPEQTHFWRGNAYAFIAVGAAEYARSARVLSHRWDTVAAPAAQFRCLGRPFGELVAESAPGVPR